MKCDLCGSIVDQFFHDCSCGHGVCYKCHEELEAKYIYGFPQCFWWSCEFYGLIKVPESGLMGEITLNAQRFGAFTGWTTELAEDSLVSIPQTMFSEMAESMAEQEEHRMMGGDQLDLSELNQMIDSIEDQGHRETHNVLSPQVRARLRQTEEFQELQSISAPPRQVGRTQVRENIIADRRRISHTRPSRFERDMEEIRVTERIQFAPSNNNAIAHISDVI